MKSIQKRTWAEISLGNILHNYLQVKNVVGGSKVLCVVKADAYGHGAAETARMLEENGADFFAVAIAEEALELRGAGIKKPILILGHTDPQCARMLSGHDIRQAVFDEDTAREFSAAAVEPVKVHIKVDTGMSRLGFSPDDTDAIARVCALPNIEVEGIFTHFATADTDDEEYTRLQLKSFLNTIDELASRGIRFEIRHCANSAAALKYPETHLDMVRAGIVLYGCCEGFGERLKPTMTLKTRVAQVKELPKGTTIGYSRTSTLERDSRVAVLPIGYADGFSRKFSRKFKGTAEGRKVVGLGNICMDMSMVDVTDAPEITAGTAVVLFGEGGESVENYAKIAETIPYEVFCAVSARVPRLYMPDERYAGEVYKI